MICLGQEFEAQVLETIEMTILCQGKLDRFLLPPGRYMFKRETSLCGSDEINRVVLVDDPAVRLSEAIFRLFFHPNKGKPGIQVCLV